jgi:hypothetical protein
MNYNALKNTARNLLANFGQSMVLTKYLVGTYNATTGENSSTTSTTTDIGVILPYGDGLKSTENSLIKQDDQQVFIQMSVIPNIADKLTINSIDYDIVSVKAIEPAGVNVLYELQVRK